MLTKYFKFKTKQKDFLEDAKNIIEKSSGKKVILYGNTSEFKELNKLFEFKKSLNIVALADTGNNKSTKGCNIKVIKPVDIKNEMFDEIIVISEDAEKAYNQIFYNLGIENKEIHCLFKEEIKDARKNLLYLLEHNFDKTLPKLIKRLKNKKVVLYGAGILFKVMRKYFDFSGLNVVSITDMTFRDTNENNEFMGYSTCKPQELDKMDIDYVLVTTKRYYEVWEHLYFDFLEKTKVKVKSIIKRGFIEKILEIAE